MIRNCSNLSKRFVNFLPFFVVKALHQMRGFSRKKMLIRTGAQNSAGESRRLLFDVTRVSKLNRLTGISRVIIELGRSLATISPTNTVELVFFRLSKNGQLIEAPVPALEKNPPSANNASEQEISVLKGDVFLFPDVTGAPAGPRPKEIFRLRAVGAKVFFVGYDMLPLTHKNLFTKMSRAVYLDWTRSVLNSDGVLSISEASRREFEEALGSAALRKNPFFRTFVIQLGATPPAQFRDSSLRARKEKLGGGFCFLMVGTLEPRKGYLEVLEVFDRLWREGQDHTLTIIGGKGWKTEKLINRITHHREYGKRLKWLSEASDKDLWEEYHASDALIANSSAEGFGLPLIEASLSGLPLIVNRIPPFQEIAGNQAFYFESGLPESLRSAILNWTKLYQTGKHPDSSGIDVKTWDEVAGKVISSIILPHKSEK